MRRSNKTMAVLAAATIAITAGFAVNNANAAPSNGTLSGTGSLLLCVSEGQGYLVADGPDFIQTQTLNNTCNAPVEVEAGTYYIKADKYIDSKCYSPNDTGSTRVRGPLNEKARCHAKVHHAHTSRYDLPQGVGMTAPFERPASAPFTTIDVPGYAIVNVVANARTEVRMHVVDHDYPECLTPPAGRTCNSTVLGNDEGI